MSYSNFIRGIVKKHPELKLKLKRANKNLTPFQYVHQTIMMFALSMVFFLFLLFLIFNSRGMMYLLIAEGAVILFSPVLYKFWFGYIDVQIKQLGRELDGDLLFVSEYFLVSLESGLPLGNAIQRISKLNRPGGIFFKRVYTDFQTGKDLEEALNDASNYAPTNTVKVLLKRLHDSMKIGVDLRSILENFIEESSEKKIIEIKSYSKKLNPIVMMYLLLGIVLPSLGVTFFILGAAILEITPKLLMYILIAVFMFMFMFQYIAYSMFKFAKSTV
jgi:Flp pilus assembly protein TadB